MPNIIISVPMLTAMTPTICQVFIYNTFYLSSLNRKSTPSVSNIVCYTDIFILSLKQFQCNFTKSILKNYIFSLSISLRSGQLFYLFFVLLILIQLSITRLLNAVCQCQIERKRFSRTRSSPGIFRPSCMCTCMTYS